jgi:predicted membrane chloride channel (bestrophin family)
MSLRKKFLATVINDIWGEMVLFTAVAVMVTVVSMLTPHHLYLNNSLLSVAGTVLGLVISFRTSSAYERYSEGRKLWTSIATTSRTMAMAIWIGISTQRAAPSDGDRAPTELECIIEKKSMINLVQALSVSIKHYLRGEPGVYYQDLYPLVCFLPRYASGGQTEADMLAMWHASEDGQFPIPHLGSPLRSNSTNTLTSSYKEEPSRSFLGSVRKHKVFDPEKVLPVVEVHRPLKPSRNPPPVGFTDYFPFLKIFKYIAKPFRKSPGSQDVDMREVLGGSKPKPKPCDSNVPVELSLFLLNYANLMSQKGYMSSSLAGNLTGGINSMQDTLCNLERVADTPLPFAYQAHLRISVWIYLLALPFQLVEPMGWLAIPGTMFATFLYLGFLEIGQEIENPFNYDLNDLDLDEFCLMIQRELHEITAHPLSKPSDYVYSALNQPFAPADRRSAPDLISANEEYTHSAHGPDSKPGKHSLQRTFLKGWRDVDTLTRK